MHNPEIPQCHLFNTFATASPQTAKSSCCQGQSSVNMVILSTSCAAVVTLVPTARNNGSAADCRLIPLVCDLLGGYHSLVLWYAQDIDAYHMDTDFSVALYDTHGQKSDGPILCRTHRIQCQICHRFGSLQPIKDAHRKFLQIYFMSNMNNLTGVKGPTQLRKKQFSKICSKCFMDIMHWYSVFIQIYRLTQSIVYTNEEEATNYPTEFLNSLDVSGLPPHNLQLKIGSECGGLCADETRRPYKTALGVTAAAVVGGKASQRAGFEMTTYPFKNNMNLGAEETLSDLNNTLKTDQNLFDRVTEQVASALNIYYIPVLIALGAIGNLLSVFVFYRSKLRFQSTSQYLSALAVSDTVFLLQLLPPWLNVVHFSGLFHQRGFCQFFVYISYVSCTLSAWIVVAFTIERFVAVLYPLQRNFVCTVRRARYVIAGIVLGSLLLNIPVLRFAIPTSNDCNIDYEYLVHAARFNLVDTAVSFTVPLAVIIVLNTWIMIGVCRFERARQQLMNAEQIVVLGNRIQQPIRQVGCPRSQQRVTRMLLIVSSVYVCLNLPAYTLRIIAYAYNKGDGESGGRWATLQQVALIFFNTNFGINFILYCLSGQNFRRALKNTMPRFGINARRAYAARRALSSHPARGSNVTTSFISNCTEATSNCGAPAATSTLRRRHPQRYISRWTFDNSRQRRAQGYSCGSPESIELRAVDPGHHRFRNLDQPPGDR
ncbi:RYamide receptor [Battus philenor]|uniref:RYamide receptor n=1 Tax=Battus philenor TaxID=42288 RepID=UPI0035D059C2